MPKPGKFSIFSINELLASPRLRPVIERLHPASVLSTVKGVYEDVSEEMLSAATERRIPDLADLTEKILARLQDIERRGDRLIIDASGILFPTPTFNYALGRTILDEMLWRLDFLDASPDYGVGSALPAAMTESDPSGEAAELSRGEEPYSTAPAQKITPSTAARVVCSRLGAEDALFFPSPELAELCLFQTFGRGGAILTARRDMTEDHSGRRLADRLSYASAPVIEVGASNSVRLSDYLSPLAAPRRGETEVGLIRLASELAAGHPLALLPEEIRTLNEAYPDVPVLLRCDYAPLIDLSDVFLDPIPTVGDLLATQVDLILFGGGQLIGGPPCGILAGSKQYLDRIRSSSTADLFLPHPIDLAGMVKTFELYKNAQTAEQQILILRLLSLPTANLQNRAERLLPQLRLCRAVKEADIRPATAYLTPDRQGGRLASVALAIKPAGRTAGELAQVLASARPALVGSTDGDVLALNLKTVPPEFDALIVKVFEELP